MNGNETVFILLDHTPASGLLIHAYLGTSCTSIALGLIFIHTSFGTEIITLT